MLAIEVSLGVAIASGTALTGAALLLLSSLFGPTLKYKISSRTPLRNDSEDFVSLLESLADAKANPHPTFEVLTNGPAFYPAELDAIRSAERSIDLEAYIFNRGEIGDRFVEALTERARAGVAVKLVLDSFGCLGTPSSYFSDLIAAGGRVVRYNSPRWYTLFRFDNRTHRELLIVDGKTAFIGGAGIADQWLNGKSGKPRWRDTVVRVGGDAVTNLQATFAENWLESSGELIVGPDYFPTPDTVSQPPSPAIALVVNSSPTNGGSTRARILFQLLLASASRSIHIASPYFLPDKSMQEELLHAIRDRGVEIKVLVPGKKSDHLLTRSASRRSYGDLLKAGAEVFEYEPSMIHAKILMIDGLWSVVGSTNLDNRSFGINDEVNLAVRSAQFTARLEQDFAADLAQARRMSFSEWRERPLAERIPELLGWVFEHQQ